MAAKDIDYISLQTPFGYRLWTRPERALKSLVDRVNDVVVPQWVWTRDPREFTADDTDFIHLHVRSDFSYHQSTAHARDLAERCSRLGQPGCAMTDVDSVIGTWLFRKEMESRGLTPIVGMTLHVSEGPHDQKIAENYQLVLLAMNEGGWKNLLRLTSIAWTSGFYRMPRVDHELLEQYSSGLVCLSGGLKGKILESLAVDDDEAAWEEIDRLQEIFGDNFYLEFAPWVDEWSAPALAKLSEYALDTGLPTVVTGDVQWTSPWDTDIARVLKADNFRDKRTVVPPEDRVDPVLKETEPDKYKSELIKARDKFQPGLEPLHHLSTSSELRAMFEERLPEVDYRVIDQGMANTLKIFKQVEPYTIDKSFKLPKDDGEVDVFEVAKANLTEMGLMDKEEYQERFDKEVGVIEGLGFTPYFAMLNKLMQFINKEGIFKGPGRGSGGGSLIIYGLGVTDVDPLQHGLLMERFLNPGRVSLPDVDIDICSTQRDQVYDFVTEKYPHTANIPTVLTMGGRKTVDVVFRVFGMSSKRARVYADEIPDWPQGAPSTSMMETLRVSPLMQKLYENQPEVVEAMIRLEGTVFGRGKHPAGVVVSPIPLDENLGLMVRRDKGTSLVQVQASMKDVEKQGYIKLDILGLKNMAIVAEAVQTKWPERSYLEHKRWLTNINLVDKRSMSLVRQGDTRLCFQVGTPTMIRAARTIQPQVFDDMSALVAIVRPGASDWIPAYAQGDYRPDEPKLWPIVRDTKGIILYQEQSIRCASELAGFTLSEADLLRRAIGHKLAEEMRALRPEFIKGCVNNGLTQESAENIFGVIQASEAYSFNKCLVEETRVKTPNGAKTIAELRDDMTDDGLPIISFDPETQTEYEDVCVEVIPCGRQEVYEVEFSDGSIEQCTMEHKFLCTDGVKRELIKIFEDNFYISSVGSLSSVYPACIRLIGPRPTYNLRVLGEPHNFVLDSGVVSGNSHSVEYALLGWWTIYLYAHYPAYFISAYINTYMSDSSKKKKINEALGCILRNKIDLLPPDVNDLDAKFKVVGDEAVRIGVGLLPHVTAKTVKAFKAQAPYASLKDFHEKVRGGVNKPARLALTLAGVFDHLGERSAVFNIFKGELERKKTFDEETELKAVEPWTPVEQARMELDVLGRIFSSPMKAYTGTFAEKGWYPIHRVRGDKRVNKLTGGLITDMHVWTPPTKENDMARLEIDDGVTGGTVLIWESKWKTVVDLDLKPGDFVWLRAYPLDDPLTIAVGDKGRVMRIKEFY